MIDFEATCKRYTPVGGKSECLTYDQVAKDLRELMKEVKDRTREAELWEQASDEWQARCEIAEAELAKFHECNPGRWTVPNEFGCDMTRGDDGARHNHKVYRKEGK